MIHLIMVRTALAHLEAATAGDVVRESAAYYFRYFAKAMADSDGEMRWQRHWRSRKQS